MSCAYNDKEKENCILPYSPHFITWYRSCTDTIRHMHNSTKKISQRSTREHVMHISYLSLTNSRYPPYCILLLFLIFIVYCSTWLNFTILLNKLLKVSGPVSARCIGYYYLLSSSLHVSCIGTYRSCMCYVFCIFVCFVL
jgi:hypothetical protein